MHSCIRFWYVCEPSLLRFETSALLVVVEFQFTRLSVLSLECFLTELYELGTSSSFEGISYILHYLTYVLWCKPFWKSTESDIHWFPNQVLDSCSVPCHLSQWLFLLTEHFQMMLFDESWDHQSFVLPCVLLVLIHLQNVIRTFGLPITPIAYRHFLWFIHFALRELPISKMVFRGYWGTLLRLQSIINEYS